MSITAHFLLMERSVAKARLNVSALLEGAYDSGAGLMRDDLRQGGLRPVPGIIYSSFVQNGELLFTLGLALGSRWAASMSSVSL